ncbi:MAG: OmpW family outer membrane protein [Gallionellaceae bacterium]|nr:OmpW family outer membrane protein [Gallionellaceae bacterium]
MKRSMKRLLALAVASTALSAPAAFAADGPWMVRVRAVNLDTANKSGAIPLLAVPADAIHVSSKTIPEVDISYFFTKNIAAELILTVPQKHDVKVTQSAIGAFKAGSFRHLPPTLTLQYHFLPDSQFRPYIGAGINYTRITNDDLAVPGVTKLHLENDSWGGALQAGFDVKLGKSLFLNLDVKKIYIRSDVTAPGLGKISHVKVDPLAVGIGLGWRF